MAKAPKLNKPKSNTKYHSTSKITKSRIVSKQNNHQSKSAPKSGLSQSKASQRAKIPFAVYDRVLLLGEGDFTFALSLAENYRPAAITATSFDSLDVLCQKYPSEILVTLENLKNNALVSHDCSDTWSGLSVEKDEEPLDIVPSLTGRVKNIDIQHGIDATKLSTRHKKALSSRTPFTKIVFNFPHTGGLSTDVNRQVRANQELLVSFFKAAQPLLASPSNPAKSLTPQLDTRGGRDESEPSEEDADKAADMRGQDLSHGQILVTLFESEPYTLWNIRDLARHTGLQVIESFKFPWNKYPGYQHARTIGDITHGKDRSDEGKRKGAWRGEERDARTYVIVPKEQVQTSTGKTGKRKSRGSDDSD